MKLKNYLDKLKGVVMNDRVFIISLLIGFMTLVSSIAFYKYNELQAMKSNIESAIVKGIDPVAVRCAYAQSNDVVCVAYAATSTTPSKK